MRCKNCGPRPRPWQEVLREAEAIQKAIARLATIAAEAEPPPAVTTCVVRLGASNG